MFRKSNIKPEELRLYAVTDRAWTGALTLFQQVEQAIDGGATLIQLREKNLPYGEFLKEAAEMKKLCHCKGVKLIINDNVQIAKECGADGVHLGQNDVSCAKAREILGEKAVIGVSARTPELALKAQNDGADYIGVGAAFPTSTKQDAKHLGIEGLRKVCKSVDIPAVAIGGITAENVKELAYSGVDGIAVVSAVFAQEDVKKAAEVLRAESDKIARRDVRRVLTVAGSDSSGGAGIQADIKTITAHRMFAMSAVTALTAQNTTGVFGVLESTPEFLRQQLDAVFEDIRPDSVKIGMVSNCELIVTIAEALKKYEAENIVLDPVMVSTSGCRLISENAIEALVKRLFPLAAVITPNIPEAELLCGFEIKTEDDAERAAKALKEMTGGAVLIKGGHSVNDASDFLYDGKSGEWIRSERINNPNTHGTGCTLSSAIACSLADGCSVSQSVKNAKKYLEGAIKAGLDLGKGSGPLEHFCER